MIAIRPVGPRDIEALAPLWDALNRDGRAADPRFQVKSDARAWFGWYAKSLWSTRDPFPGAFIALDGDKAVGFVAGTLAHPNPVLEPAASVVITDMYVAPEARRQGLGRRLVDAFIEAAMLAGYRGVEVGTLIKDTRAVAFWSAMGFDAMRVTLVRP